MKNIIQFLNLKQSNKIDNNSIIIKNDYLIISKIKKIKKLNITFN